VEDERWKMLAERATESVRNPFPFFAEDQYSPFGGREEPPAIGSLIRTTREKTIRKVMNLKKTIFSCLVIFFFACASSSSSLVPSSPDEICGRVDFVPLPPGGQVEFDYVMTLWDTGEIVHLAPPLYTEYDNPDQQQWEEQFWSIIKEPGDYRIYNPVRDGGWVTLFSSVEKVADCGPLQTPTLLPAPPDTRLPPPTDTRIAFTDTPTPLSTLVIPPPASKNGVLELQMVPVSQHLTPSITLSNGLVDSGDFDCFIASMSMALEYFKNQNVLDDSDTTHFRSLVPVVRGTLDPGISILNNPSFVGDVTHNKIIARAWYTKAENLSAAIEAELRAGRPVVAGTPDWSLLAAHWTGRVGHSIIVYGFHDGKIFYIDPWGGGRDNGRYEMAVPEFTKADTFPSGSFLITFERSQG
jgi:hypothetical protein